MALSEHFFTYRLFDGWTTMRIGKGGVRERSEDAIRAYLREAYPSDRFRWTHYGSGWHMNEGAAYKAERRQTDEFERATGELPPWNVLRGGTGGRAFEACKATLLSGDRCMNLALAGNYGYCGVHR